MNKACKNHPNYHSDYREDHYRLMIMVYGKML